MNYETLKGKFLVVDGPDGAGKSTQVQRLGEWIERQGVEVLLCRDPGGTRIGEQIRRILLDKDHTEMGVRCETLLYMASRSQLYDEIISPALASKVCVLSDRWISSTYAYQAVAGKLGPEELIRIAESSLERCWPDLTIIVDLPAATALGRVGQTPDRMELKGSEFHHQVREAFLELSKGRGDFSVVDGHGTIEQVHQRICETVNGYVGS